mgnify:FL=1
MVINTLFPWFASLNRDWDSNWDKKVKSKVYLLGNGWLARGFMDHIHPKKFNIINIYNNEITNTPLLFSDNVPTITFPNYTTNIMETIKSIDIDYSAIITDKQCFKYTDKDFVVCGLGDNVPISSWQYRWSDVQKAKNIAIVGSGNTGTSLAFKLNDMSKKVTVDEGLKDSHTYLPDRLKKYVINKMMVNNIGLITDTMYDKKYDSKYDNVTFAIGSRSNDLVSDYLQNETLSLQHNNVSYPNIFLGGNCVRQTKVLNVDGTNTVMGPNAQVAYDQGKHIAQTLNRGHTTVYKSKNFVHTLYVGNNLSALYMNNYNGYLLVPQSLVKLYLTITK